MIRSSLGTRRTCCTGWQRSKRYATTHDIRLPTTDPLTYPTGEMTPAPPELYNGNETGTYPVPITYVDEGQRDRSPFSTLREASAGAGLACAVHHSSHQLQANSPRILARVVTASRPAASECHGVGDSVEAQRVAVAALAFPIWDTVIHLDIEVRTRSLCAYIQLFNA